LFHIHSSHAAHTWHSAHTAHTWHSTHSWHTAHSWHSAHAAHSWHSTHAAHSRHSAHSSHSWHTAAATTAEIVHIFFIPVFSEGFCTIFFIFVDPFAPINLYMSILDFIFGYSWPVISIWILFANVEYDVSTFNVPLAIFNLYFIEEYKIKSISLSMRVS
jgi:hypothetical protein